MGSVDSAVRQGLVFFAVALCMAAGAFVLAGREAALCCLAVALAAMVYYHAILWLRHRQVQKLALRIDEVLHGSRDVSFVNCRESDIAMLGNELGKMVARLQRTSSDLECQRQSLSEALADVSHQIRTPLTTMALMLPVLEGEADQRARRRSVRQLEDMLERVSWLVTTLLKIAKADAGAIRITKRDTTPAAIAQRAVQPLLAQLDLHDVSLEMDCDEGTVQLDELWTAEALENIVKNCMEHTPAGGRIRLAAENDALTCRFVITDTGCGIAEGERERIFDRFYSDGSKQPSSALTDDAADAGSARAARGVRDDGRPSGFGIGLSLAMSLVSMQEGTIRADNTSEGGARFTITFPKLVV
ncbi:MULTISPECIES: sensor histidine kinase [Adlercreutzia]|uniref:histidine kinase n=1 Tax=Muribaculaceae bacterium Z82 TaxID=2304548 RepID=A0A7C9JQL0_9BACT|nr:HAMP domain-containing sensor histidine kinase [Adlercreutzia aquisgranensis]